MLMESKRMMEAIFVMNMVTEIYPDSADAWNNLAGALHKAGQTDKAKAIYQKVMNMDPEGEAGTLAQKMYEEIKATPMDAKGH